MSKNLLFPTVCGIGYLGIGVYNVKENGDTTKAYKVWSSMLHRAYSSKYKNKFLTYMYCTVITEWKCFQNFAKWHEENFNPETMQEWELDKDILIKRNKIYSPETCCFVPKEINYLFVKRDKVRGNLPIGVSKSGKKYMSRLNKNGKLIYLGTFDTIGEAFQAYKTAKEDYIKEVADKWKPFIALQTYYAMYNYKIEITD